MKNRWIAIEPEKVEDNVFTSIGSDWMLVTAGTMKSWNTLTASWGGLGVLWGRKVAFVFIRESRHTRIFMDSGNGFSLAFFPDGYRDALNFCGTKSGRDVDKAVGAGITPREFDGTVAFDEARLVFTCKKIYYQDIEPERFLDESIHDNYATGDYHRMYVGAITGCHIAQGDA